MNTLLYALVRALRRHRWLSLLGCAFILSSIGNGLTQVVVFGQLLRWNAPATTLVLAYALATLPGFLGSLLGERLCQRHSPFRVLLLAEMLGAASLMFPLYSLLSHNTLGLLAVQACSAVMSGMTFPALALIFKRGLQSEELPAATCMETLIFAAQVLLGVGIGVLLFGHIATGGMLLLDALSFIASGIFLLRASRCFVCVHSTPFPTQNTLPARKIRWREMTHTQRRSLLMLPALAMVGTPAMSLLPALAQTIRPNESTGLALPLLFARSLGQLCGPLLLPADKLANYAGSNGRLVLCLIIFLGGYLLVPQFPQYGLAPLGFIFIAHVASNVVFALATFGILNAFDAPSLASASSQAWRWQIVMAGIIALIVGGLAQWAGALTALYSTSLFSFCAVCVMLGIYRR